MGPSSGLIIAFVVAVWAAYFVPLVLRRYDEAGKNASVQEAGATGRVIAATRPAEPEVASAPTAEAAPADTPHVPLDRPAAQRAARRRRRTLQTLLVLLALTTVAAFTPVVPWPAVAAPAALIIAWLVACRIQVRGELGLSVPKAPRVRVKKSGPGKSGSLAAPQTPDQEDTVVVSGQFEEVDPGRRHVMERGVLTEDSLDDQIVIAVPSLSMTGEALWDPLPVTLPTYVTKPRAGRTVRTIDFAQPGAWTSGHIEGEDVVLPQRSIQGSAQRANSDAGGDERRAVGS